MRRFVATADLFLGAGQVSGFHNDGKVLARPREVVLDKVQRTAMVLKQESLATMHSKVETPVDLRQANAPIKPEHLSVQTSATDEAGDSVFHSSASRNDGLK